MLIMINTDNDNTDDNNALNNNSDTNNASSSDNFDSDRENVHSYDSLICWSTKVLSFQGLSLHALSSSTSHCQNYY